MITYCINPNPNPQLRMNPKKMKFGTSLRMTTSPDAAGSLPIPPEAVEAASAPARAVIPRRRCLPTEQRADGRAVRRRMVACVVGRRATRRCHQRTDAAGQHLRTPADSTYGIPPPRRLPRGWTRNRRAEEREMDARPLAAEPPPAVVNE
jgi:hypothetical protein